MDMKHCDGGVTSVYRDMDECCTRDGEDGKGIRWWKIAFVENK